jgi:hypothetical protein
MVGAADDPSILADAFDALRRIERRRILLELLNSYPRGVSVLTLRDIVHLESDPDVTRAQLHHRHLPKLAEQGFVEWNGEGGLVTHGERFPEIVPLLELLAENEAKLPGTLR